MSDFREQLEKAKTEIGNIETITNEKVMERVSEIRDRIIKNYNMTEKQKSEILKSMENRKGLSKE